MAKANAAKSESLYGVHPGVAMVQKSMAELKEKTGRSLEAWIALVKKEGPKDEKSQRGWLKTKHKLGMNRTGGSRSAQTKRAEIGHARSVFEERGPVCGGTVRRSERKVAAGF